MAINIYSSAGKKTQKTVTLPKEIFGSDVNQHVVWLNVKAILANKRQGTHDSKGRSYVSGGGRKPFRQKGTGRARQGTIRAPHHVGGGRVFGPHPRSYFQKVNKKVKNLARKSVLTDKAVNNKIFVVENFDLKEAKTKSARDFIKSLGLENQKVLLVTNEYSPNLYKSFKNIYGSEVKHDTNFSTYDVVKSHYLVLQEGVIDKLKEVLQ